MRQIIFGGENRAALLKNVMILFCSSRTFVEPQGTHMVSINQPSPPFQADRPWWRKLKLKAKCESGTSYWCFKRSNLKIRRFNRFQQGFNGFQQDSTCIASPCGPRRAPSTAIGCGCTARSQAASCPTPSRTSSAPRQTKRCPSSARASAAWEGQ